MKYLLGVVALFLACNFALGQSNYKPGYFVNNQNDTVRGFIDQRERFNNPKEFDFKQDPSQKTTKISLADAKAVGITGYDYYEKFTVKISTGYVNINRLNEAVDTAYITDDVFLRVIKKGKNVSLYAYTDNVKTRYYLFDNADKNMAELNYYVYLNTANRTVATYDKYKVQLADVATKHQAMNSDLDNRITNTPYDESSVLKIVQRINGDKGNGQSASKNLSAKRFFVGLGAQNSKLTFSGETLAFIDGTSRTSLSPTVSGGIDFILNKETQKVIFRIEGSFASDKYNMDYVLILDQEENTYATLDLKVATVSVHPQLIYNFFSSNSIKLFVDAGFVFNKLFYNNYTYTTYDVVSPTVIITLPRSKFPVFQATSFSVPVKLGVVINKHIEIYAAYAASASITKYLGSSTSIGSYQGGINYLFGMK